VVAGVVQAPELLSDLEARIARARIATRTAVSREIIFLYWRIGQEKLARQKELGWGASDLTHGQPLCRHLRLPEHGIRNDGDWRPIAIEATEMMHLGQRDRCMSVSAIVACGSTPSLHSGEREPGLLGKPVPQVLKAVRAYVDEVRRTDIQRVDGVAHDPEKVLLLMRSLARNVSTMVSLATLARDVDAVNEALAKNTVSAYYDALTRLMVVEDQPAWAPHLRSRSRVRTSPRCHFVDPSLAVAVLRATPERLLQDLNLLGFLFESLVIRDLRVYAQACDAEVLHYKDNTDLEVDAVVELADGRWAAFEIKLGTGEVDVGAESLKTFARRVDTRKCGPPQALGVITGTGVAYTRSDGVSVIPIGVLGP
jgi:hypothetical protein